MAMMDNVNFLISHIRNSFVTSDDTSMSEWVITECRIQDEDIKREGNHRYNRNNHSSRSDSSSDCQSDTELKGSMDIHPDMDFGAHRRRSNTAQRLERLKKEKRSQSKMKTVLWKDVPEAYKVNEKGHLFEKKDLADLQPTDSSQPQAACQSSGTNEKKSNLISSLSQQLEEMEAHGSNPFFKYAKFDGRTAGGLPTRKLDIFLAFAPAEQRAYPMSIIVTANAKAEEVMGLVCWQYTEEGRKPDIQAVVGHIDPKDLCKFSLQMAEDDGEIDTDFPPIIPTDPVSKYGFTKFALVANAPVQPKSVVVTIYVPNRGFNKFQVDSMQVTMKELMEKVIKRRKIKTSHDEGVSLMPNLQPGGSVDRIFQESVPSTVRMSPFTTCMADSVRSILLIAGYHTAFGSLGLNYTLEKAGKSEVGKPVDLDAVLGSMNCMDFYLVRENSSRGDVESNDEEDQKIADSLMSHQYKSYIVSMVHKLRTNTEVQLGISGEKFEIDPVSMKGTARLFRQKPVTYDADSVAACDISETKTNGRAVFRVTYLNGHDYKQHHFEADQLVANEIVEKVNNILELKFSPVRKEFVYTQEKKALQKRDSIRHSTH